jgi:plastocyanin
MRFMVNVVGLAALLLATPAHATKMSGKVTIGRAYFEAMEKAENARDKGSKTFYWKLPNGIIPVRPPRIDFTGDIAVVLYRNDGSESKPDNVRTVGVETGKLSETVVVTRPGSTIKFTNESPYVHELYAPDHPDFKPEAQSKGAFRPIEFKTEGIYKIRCKRMPHFLGYVVVTGGRQLTLKSDGTFAEEIEPGGYSLKVFHDGAWVHEQSFTAEGKHMDPITVALVAKKSVEGAAEAPKTQQQQSKEPSKKKDKQ